VLLGTDAARDPCQYGVMKKKPLAEHARTTISSVNKEMQKPRLTESVRKGERDKAEPVVEDSLLVPIIPLPLPG
jgi:hypothetical protein